MKNGRLMSEGDTSRSEQAAMDSVVAGNASDFSVSSQPSTARALFRKARQEQGFDIDTLASLLKIHDQAFFSGGNGHGRGARHCFSRSAVLMGLTLLLGAIALISLPFIQLEIARYRHADSGVEKTIELVEPSFIVSNSAVGNLKAMIAFNATGESWLKVTDAKGAVMPGRMLRTDESAGQPPLAIVVRRAHVI